LSIRAVLPVLPLLLVVTLGGAAPATPAVPAAAGPGASAVAAVAAVAVPAPASVRLRVVNHNIEKRPAALARALRVARRSRAQVVTLQEVCSWQVAQLRRRHPRWTVAFKPERISGRCRSVTPGLPALTGSGRMVGNVAVWTGGARGAVATHTFRPQRVVDDRVGLACVSWRTSVRLRACSVHLISPSAPEDVGLRTAQARDVRRITDPWIRRDQVVVLGGDFNARPGRRTMRQLYDGAAGRFREATGRGRGGRGGRGCCAASTYDGAGVKIDYIFYSANRTGARSHRNLRIVRTVSDHHLLVGSADVDTSRG
jgi:endonuclease/exonuclease/phosphatase (EEP) superfamily protein YafD